MSSPSQSLSELLNSWNSGDDAAGRAVFDVVYKELRRLAAHYMQVERPGHTLQPTALVHELYLKLFASEPVEWTGKGHFLAVAALQMRHIVVDYARNRSARKRGGEHGKVAIDEAPDIAVALDDRVLDLDIALTKLSSFDSRAGQVVELRYFGGLTEAEIGEVLNISVATVKRDWEFARTWLLNEIE